MPGDLVRLATRASPLALWQAEHVAGLLSAVGVSCELVPAVTEGDARQDVPVHRIGGRGVFTKEVDAAVLAGRAEVSVHSAKDLPSVLEQGLVIGAIAGRADVRDALVGSGLRGLAAGALVATGSVRRRAQLAWLRPDLGFVELRGNMATRLEKVPPGGAVVAAMAALERLGWRSRAAEVLSTVEVLPQVGQGAIAACCLAGSATAELLGWVEDAGARAEVDAERAWLSAVGGGCDAPVGALGRFADGEVELTAMIASPDGHVLVRDSLCGRDPLALGAALADRLLDRRGGRALLDPGLGATL